MDNRILELKCNNCVKLDKYQFIVSFNSLDNEKYTMKFSEEVPIGTSIRINSFYHTIQKYGDTFRISIFQSFISLSILELFLADKFELKNGEQLSFYKDSNTLEVFKMTGKVNKLKLDSVRIIRLKEENLVVYKEAHLFNGNYIIENWIHHME